MDSQHPTIMLGTEWPWEIHFNQWVKVTELTMSAQPGTW